MAVEANLNLLRSQLLSNRNEGNGGIYNTQMGSGGVFAGAMPGNLPRFPQPLVGDSVPMKIPAMKSDSGVTYNVPSAPRKRYRDSVNDLISGTNFSVLPNQANNNNNGNSNNSINNLSDVPMLIHQHQLEIDHLVSNHTKRLRLELEERQKQQARLLVSAIGEGVVKKLKDKDEQIQRMGKLNWVLQERVKSLFAENQLWRDLAQSNEATANSLRTNLEQILLAHVSNDRPVTGGNGSGGGEDAESCCDNGDFGKDVGGEEVEWRMLAAEGRDEKGVKDKVVVVGGGGENGKRMCKRCGERESSVLLLPCRHLCLCRQCGSSLTSTCPVCNSSMNATLHVNMS